MCRKELNKQTKLGELAGKNILESDNMTEGVCKRSFGNVFHQTKSFLINYLETKYKDEVNIKSLRDGIIKNLEEYAQESNKGNKIYPFNVVKEILEYILLFCEKQQETFNQPSDLITSINGIVERIAPKSDSGANYSKFKSFVEISRDIKNMKDCLIVSPMN